MTSFRSKPSKKWEMRLSGFGSMSGPKLRKGNAVVVSARGDQIYITSDDGRLHIKNTNYEWDTGKSYTPPIVRKRDKDWYTTGHSGVSLYSGDDEDSPESVKFAVYAVIDSPPKYLTDPMETQSRIIAVDKNGNELWIHQLTGIVSGTPIISKYGRFIYVNYNRFDPTRQATVGHFSVLDGDLNGALHYIEPVNIYSHAMDEWDEKWQWKRMQYYYGGSPYGPITRINVKKNRDLLFWGENARDGYGSQGALHRSQVDCRTGYVDSEIVDYTLGYSVSTAPVIADGGDQVYLPTANSSFFSWNNLNESKPFTINTEEHFWQAQLDLSNMNKTSPLTNRPVVDKRKRRMFVSSAGTSFNCLNAETGRILWSNPEGNTTSTYMTEAKLDPTDERVYSIQHLDGRVISQIARTGEIKWEWNCTDVTRETYCQDSVEAEFALSPDGLTLYYGDIFGKIVALAVAEQMNPTDSPTPLPTTFPSIKPSFTNVPSIGASNHPSLIPTFFPTVEPSNHPSSEPSDQPSFIPSVEPTFLPTTTPSTAPTSSPSIHPSASAKPSVLPTDLPSISPTTIPSESPSTHPTHLPSIHPSHIPTLNPTPYYGILTLKSIPPEGQVAAVSFIGLSGILALLGFVLGSRRYQKRESRNDRNDERIDGDLNPDEDSMIAIGPSGSMTYSDNGINENASIRSDKAMIGRNFGNISSSEDDKSLATSLSSILEETAIKNTHASSPLKKK